MAAPQQRIIPVSLPNNNMTSRLAVDESLELFLQQFYAQYMVDVKAQEVLRGTLAKKMIRSMYSLSRKSPRDLINEGLPALFVDECNRSGMLRSAQEGDDKLPATSQMPSIQKGSNPQNVNKCNAVQSTTRSLASRSTPYKKKNLNSQRAENWSVDEMLILLDAKKLENEIASVSRSAKRIRPARETWKAVSDRVLQRNVQKTPHQCWIKWVKLNKHFRKIFNYENNRHSSNESFWNLSSQKRKEKSMPASFNQEVYNTMVEKFGDNKEAHHGDISIAPPTAGEKQSNVGEALHPSSEIQKDVLPVSSELLQPKRKRTTLPVTGMPIQSFNQLAMRYEEIENQSLHVERHRIVFDERSRMLLCESFLQIANALQLIAQKIHPKP